MDGFLLAGSTAAAVGQTVNLGTGREISIGDLAKLIGRLVGRELAIETDGERMQAYGEQRSGTPIGLQPESGGPVGLVAEGDAGRRTDAHDPNGPRRISTNTGLRRRTWCSDELAWREGVGITGVTGAIGSRLARRLAEAGANVIGLSRTRPEGVLEGTEHRCADVRDIEGMRAGLRGCSAVFHLAGEANASVAAADPVECFGVNLEGTTNVMYACGREEYM